MEPKANHAYGNSLSASTDENGEYNPGLFSPALGPLSSNVQRF